MWDLSHALPKPTLLPRGPCHAPAGQPLMLPLTQSLYVSGTVANVDQVLVDIGTGYYVEVRRHVRLSAPVGAMHPVRDLSAATPAANECLPSARR